MTNYLKLVKIGFILACISIFGMIFIHEFSICELLFILGITIAGFGYAKLPPSEKIPVNTEKINKNLQDLNDVLWGEEKKR
jgi:hypothetical protein